jgi:hypothetical protein
MTKKDHCLCIKSAHSLGKTEESGLIEMYRRTFNK